LAVVVARSVGRAEFGAFSVCFLIFGVCIGVERALVGQPMSIRYSSANALRWTDGVSRALGTALAWSTGAGALCVVTGWWLDGPLGPALIATGVVLPALVVQDSARLAFFARSGARLAAMNDALWAVVQCVLIGALIAADLVTVPSLVLAWGAAAAVCVLVALAQLGALPSVRGARSWLREHRDLWGYLLAEYVLGAGAFQGGVLVVGALAGGARGLAIVGAFRAAQVVLGPLGVLAAAIQTFALPQLSRRTELSARARWQVATGIGAAMATVSGVYVVVVHLLPSRVGHTLFRSSWDGAREVLLPIAVGAGAGWLCLGTATGIYALGLARRTFWIMCVEAPLVFTLMIAGSVLDGARGAAWGLCLDQVLLVPVWFWVFARILRNPSSTAAGSGRSTVTERATG
jgi:O-antigen/teichoic acid export membrane protein